MKYLSVLKRTEDKKSHDQLLYVEREKARRKLNKLLHSLRLLEADYSDDEVQNVDEVGERYIAEQIYCLRIFFGIMYTMGNDEPDLTLENDVTEIFIDWLEEDQRKIVMKAIDILQ